MRGWCCSSARVLGQIICSEQFLRSAWRISRLNKTIPCEGASPDLWVVTCLTLRGTSLDCLSPLGASVFVATRRVSPAAYWASWADCLHTIQSRHPSIGEQMTAAQTNHVTANTCRQLWRAGTSPGCWPFNSPLGRLAKRGATEAE